MKKTELTRFDQVMAAVSFAEEAEFNIARELMLDAAKAGQVSPVPAVSSSVPANRAGRNRQHKVAWGILILTGLLSAGLYTLLLTNQEMLNENFSKGGLYALLPIATAFIFSYFHGTFTGHFWTVLGVEASKKKTEVK